MFVPVLRIKAPEEKQIELEIPQMMPVCADEIITAVPIIIALDKKMAPAIQPIPVKHKAMPATAKATPI